MDITVMIIARLFRAVYYSYAMQAYDLYLSYIFEFTDADAKLRL